MTTEENNVKQLPMLNSNSFENCSSDVIESSLLGDILLEFASTYQIEWIIYYLKSAGLLCHNECKLINKKREIAEQFQKLFQYLTFKPFDDVIKILQQICIDIDWPKILRAIISLLEKSDRKDLIINGATNFSMSENVGEFAFPSLQLDAWRNLIWLGSGSFGEVRLCSLWQNKAKVACKRVYLQGFNNDKQINAVTRELAIHRSLNNQYIVKLFGFRFVEPYAYFFMEYMPGGSLKEEIISKGCLIEEETLFYVKQILLGLTYLHENGIVHRDLKNRNILKDNEKNIKLSDFGESKQLLQNNLGDSVHSNTADVGTDHFMAPEVITGDPYGRKADIWSLGCVIVEMLTGKPPWGQYNGYTVKYLIGSRKRPVYTLHPNMSSGLHRFLDDVFDFVSERRPEAKDALELPIFSQSVINVGEECCEIFSPIYNRKAEMKSVSKCENENIASHTFCDIDNNYQLCAANMKGRYLKKYYEQILRIKYSAFDLKFHSDGSVHMQGTQFQVADCAKDIDILLSNVVFSEYAFKTTTFDYLNCNCIAEVVKIMDTTKTLITINDRLINDTMSHKAKYVPPVAGLYFEGVINNILKVIVYNVDIATENVNAIVISSNNKLCPSEEASKHIMDEGGEQIQAECKKYISRNGTLNVSDVYVSTAGNLQCEKILHVVCAKCTEVIPDGKGALKKATTNIFRSAQSLQLNSIAVSASIIKNFFIPNDKAISVFLETVVLSSKKLESVKEIHIVDRNYEILELFIKDLLKNKKFKCTENKTTTTSSIKNSLLLKPSKVTCDFPPIFLVEDDIVNVAKTCDVIVNSVAKGEHFMLCGGYVCSAIVAAAGPEIILDAEKRYPFGIEKFGVTNAGNLGCKKVFYVHCTSQWIYKKSAEALEANIVACLNRMEKEKLESIAFPAFGTGMLRYPIDKVASVMFNTVQLWRQRHNTVALKKIIFVIMPHKKHLMDAFLQAGKSILHSTQNFMYQPEKDVDVALYTQSKLNQQSDTTRKFDRDTRNLVMQDQEVVNRDKIVAKLQVCGTENAVKEVVSMLDELLENIISD